MRRTLVVLLAVLLLPVPSRAALYSLDEPQAALPAPRCTLLVAVRHAERDPAGGSDPSLSAAGQARALALADTLDETGVSSILVSPTRRARETAAPTAARVQVAPQEIPLDGGLEIHLRTLRKAVLEHPGASVLVVGHSNTVPALLRSLGVPGQSDLAEDAYGDLFVVTLCEGEPPRLVRGRFGAS